jgi:uncharacterized membrane protein YedE/YeeE
MTQLLSQPWPWYVAGPLIGLVVPFVFWYGGKKWGMSSSIRHLCAATFPAGISYFRYEWRRIGGWHLAMVAGVVVGGAVAAFLLPSPEGGVAISGAARAELRALGLTDLSGFLPREVFSWAGLTTPAGAILIGVGSFLVGFGARYAGGCTSGHAISGLATLKRSSLAAVIGFFIGGLISAHLLLPLIL